MKLYDCSLYYDEDLILNARLNILNKYFDKFIICESKYSHSGRKKKLNFNINNFSEFKDKIIYVVNDKEPDGLIYRLDKEKKIEKPEDYSDNDEIPNMENFDQIKDTNDIVIFEQKLFYYKFNLLFDRLYWYGTKAVKKKKLINFEWLRQVKPKKYNFYRLDTLFKKDKYIQLKIVKNGGWHFTRIISPEEIHKKELDAEHHDEYRASNKNPQTIKDLIERRVIDHDHVVDSKKSKYGSEFKLKVISLDELPEFIKVNWKKYEEFLDLRP